MKYFFAYLMQNPLIRMTMFWLVVGILGISVFGWRVGTMRAELNEFNTGIQGYIIALNKIDENKAQEKQDQLKNIISEIEKYRPSVPELLGFVENVEDIIQQKTQDYTLSSIKTEESSNGNQKQIVNYRIEARAGLNELRELINNFENSPYATEIKTIQMQKNEDGAYDLTLDFILYTKLS